MKKLRWLKQETPYSCSVACLRMVMDYYGMEVTEEELRRKCKTKPDVGTHPTSLIEAAKSYNFDVQRIAEREEVPVSGTSSLLIGLAFPGKSAVYQGINLYRSD